MNIPDSDVRFCILVRGTRSATTKELVNTYCEKYGKVKYSRCAVSSQGVMRGYNVVYEHEQSVNQFMDDRPHRIDGQSVKVKRCICSDEEWRLTKEIRITTADTLTDQQIFHEETLRDYFSKYGVIHACRIDSYHNHPCAYLTFSDFDRVDQLINDKPHTVNKIAINVRKHITTDNKTKLSPSKQTSSTNTKRRDHTSTEPEHHRIKRRRSSSKITYEDNDTNLLKNANDLLIREVQSLISTTTQSIKIAKNNEIIRLQNAYGRLNTQMKSLHHEQPLDADTNRILNELQNDVENLLKQIQNMRQQKKTFADELFEKYTIEYILSLNENDVKQRLEQLEQENQLLLLIKQNMPNKIIPKLESL